MKNPETNHPINTFLLVALVCGGLTLLGSRPAAAENHEHRSRNQVRWERQETQHQQRSAAREKQQQVKADTRREARQEGRSTIRKPVVVGRTVTRETGHRVKGAQRRDNHDARRPIVRTVTRPSVIRERSVIRTVSRPVPRGEVRDYRRPQHIQRPEVRHHPRRDVIIKTLPRGSRTVVINRERYHTHGGRYYRHTPRGYLLVRLPLGTIVADLPFGFLRVSFGGLDYVVWNNVFYRHTPRGYRVVETPSGYQESDFGPVRVEAARLNIRTGPGLGFDVIGWLEQGDLLLVAAASPDWYYVLLSNGEYGWIMSRHTALIARG